MRKSTALIFVICFMVFVLLAFNESTVFPGAKSTMTFGYILLTAYLLGDILSWFRLPKITGYILAGIVFGPHVLKLINSNTLSELKLLDDFALSFIALAAGGELRLNELKDRRNSIILTVFFLTVTVFSIVAIFTVFSKPFIPFLEGKPTSHLAAVAIILGAISVARSPSSAIAIISECKARGPFTDMVLGVTVVMDVLVIIIFTVVISLCKILVNPGTGFDFYFLLIICIELTGSIFAGIVLGNIISLYIEHVKVELPVFILGMVFIVSFFSRHFAVFLDQVYGISFHLEPMLICITSGFLVQNFSSNGKIFLEKIDRSSLPVYVLFFSLTGAALKVDTLGQTWLFTLLLVGVRIVAIWFGAYLGSKTSGDPPGFRHASGMGFITQAGVSLGLAGIVIKNFPEWGAILATTIVAIISLNQVIGPITFKLALNFVGESQVLKKT